MPKRADLILQSFYKFWVRVSECVHSDPRAEIEKSSSVRRNQIDAFTFLECNIGPPVGGHNGCVHGLYSYQMD